MTVTTNDLAAASIPAADPSPADFDALFAAHWARVCALLFRLLGDWGEAEELALDVFWRLHQQPPAPGSNVAGWLYRVATNLGFNALRARRRRQRYEEAGGQRLLDSTPPPNPAAEAERADERAQVRRVLAEMKPRSAHLLLLRHSGFSYAEIAEMLGVAAGSVGTLLARAEAEFEARYRALQGVDDASH